MAFLSARSIITKTTRPHLYYFQDPPTPPPPPSPGNIPLSTQKWKKERKKTKNYSTASYILLDSLKGSPGHNISTLLKKKRNPVCKSEYVQTLQLKQAFFAS